jgi:methionyl-tRNA synthetase
VPGDPEQIVWVWFDALANYLATAGFPGDEERCRRLWSDADRRVHAVGKGIARFHAVLWPALLLSAGLPLPTTLWVHGYVTVNGQKIGKSQGNAVDPAVLVERFGVDAVRYFLLRHVGAKQDADVDEARLAQVVRSELADGPGNLLARTIALLCLHAGARVPPAPAPGLDVPGEALAARADALQGEVDEAAERFAPDDALRAIAAVVAAANKHLADTAPWTLAKDPARGDEVRAILHHTAGAIGAIGRSLRPFLPSTAAAIRRALDAPEEAHGVLFPKPS